MKSLEDCQSEDELVHAINTLPEGLDQAYGRILERVLKDLKEETSKKAVRILEWIACSFRLMKVNEIQDGIVLHTKDVELNERTKLRDGNFLDLCKPLIEKCPKNTVDFVHFSAKEYILRGASGQNGGPFLHYAKAQYDLAFACMSYMRSSMRFIEPTVTENERRLRVFRGFHGLHHYANEFWFQHFLRYSNCGDPVDDDELDTLIQELGDFWKHDPGFGAKRLKIEDTTSADSIVNQLQDLVEVPQAFKMGLDLLTFRRFLSQEKYSHQSPESLKKEELHHDPTQFSKISQVYQAIVRSLIDCSDETLPDGAQSSELKIFKEIYTDSAFICRYRECDRYSDGFRTSAERDEHEKLQNKPLRCAEPTCEFWRRGFTSKTGLLKHNRKYHPSPDELPLPAFEPYKEPEPMLIPAPAVVLQAAPQQQRHATPAPAASSESEEVEPEKTVPKRGRVSRAKKGRPVHKCDRCTKVFTRNEGLERHKLSHEPPRFHCQYEGCGRQFYRKDLLDRHKCRHETIAHNSQLSNGRNSVVSDCRTSTPQPADIL